MSLTNLGEWDPAVPDSTRLVAQKIEAKRQERTHQIAGRIKQQSDTFRAFRVNRKVERLLLFDPGHTKRQWTSLGLRPSRALSSADRTVHLSSHYVCCFVHAVSLNLSFSRVYAFPGHPLP